MATKPNGRPADNSDLGRLLEAKEAILRHITENPNPRRIEYLACAINNLREGTREKIDADLWEAPAYPPREGELIQYWGILQKAFFELDRTIFQSKMILDLDHIIQCLYWLAEGKNIQYDSGLPIPSPKEQLEAYENYFCFLEPKNTGRVFGKEYGMIQSLASMRILADDDLIFFGPRGISWSDGGAYNILPAMRYMSSQRKCSGMFLWHDLSHLRWHPKFSRPEGFYLKRLPEDDRKSGLGFSTRSRRQEDLWREIGGKGGICWYMGHELFQFFGITNKLYLEFMRRETDWLLAIPEVFEIGKNCHQCGKNHAEDKPGFCSYSYFTYPLGVYYETGEGLTLKHHCQYREPSEKIGFPLIHSWRPSEGVDANLDKYAKCDHCKSSVYILPLNFRVCSQCGKVTQH